MTWNYRVVKYDEQANSQSEYFAIHEVYYNEDGNIVSWTENPIVPCGDTPEGLEISIISMLSAFNKPVISLKDLK